ncbi:MAG TPA: response regulator [Longimicrobium sp.]|nr:response regulator [Longimicrobium sp.]
MHPHRIVVVDDDDRWLATIRGILGGHYQLDLTSDPAEAVTLVRSSPHALAILDQRISPDVSGTELLHRLREIQPGLRVIILTGYAQVEDAVDSMKGGAFDYISKGHRDLSTELRARVAKALEDPPPDQELAGLLKQGEGAELEFKSTARWDVRQSRTSRDLEGVIVKTVAGFLNASGGDLLIGVDDGGKVLGLRPDYDTLRRKDRDGFEAFLTELLLDAFGKDLSPCIRIHFHRLGDQDVCRVTASAAPRAVFVSDGHGGEHLYIRTGNSTRLLSTREAIDYCRVRWT